MSDNSTSRKIKYGTNALVGILLFLVILIAINWFADRSKFRLDLTRDKIYTISNFTDSLLKKINDKVTVTVYATQKDTPANWTEQRNQLRELLTEYRTRSNNRLQFTFKDPSVDEKVAEEAEKAGVEPQLMQEASTTDFRVQKGYLGFQVEYKGKSESVPHIKPEQPLEYQLTRSINKITQISVPNIGIVTPPSNPMMGDQGQYTFIPQQLQQEGFKVTPLTGDNLKDLNDIAMLMVLEPSTLSDESLYYIDQYVMNGGKLFVAASGTTQGGGMGMPPGMGGGLIPTSPSVNKLLETYGVRIGDSLVEDWTNGIPQPVISNGRMVTIRNPLAFSVSEFNKTDNITKTLPEILALLISPIERSDKGSSATIEILASTSKQSRLQEQNFTLEPSRIRPVTDESQLKAYDLAAKISGKLTSAFNSQPLPVLTNEDGTTKSVSADDVVRNAKEGAEVIVVGSSDMFKDRYISQVPTNIIIPINVAEALTRGGDVLTLRSNQIRTASLGKISEKQSAVTHALLLGGVPSLLILFGLARYGYNKKKKAGYRYKYGKQTN